MYYLFLLLGFWGGGSLMLQGSGCREGGGENWAVLPPVLQAVGTAAAAANFLLFLHCRLHLCCKAKMGRGICM